MPTTSTAESTIDLFTDECLDNPFPCYERLRAMGPITWLSSLQCWAVPRYDEVRAVLGDWETFTSVQGVALNDQTNAAIATRRALLNSAGDEHDLLRGVLAEHLAPRALRTMTNDIKQRAREIIEPLVARGQFDAVQDLAHVLPVNVVADLLGIPEDVRPRLIPWADAIFNSMGPADKARTFATAELIGEQFAWVDGADPSVLTEGSWGRAIFDAADQGRIDREQALGLLVGFTSAAVDTTISAIGSAVWLFAENPEQWRRLVEARSLIPSAFNEVLRLESPLQFLSRVAVREVGLAGTQVAAGQRIMVMYGSANRDERHYGPDADVFRIDRNPTDHLAFGYGPHGCIGQGLARLEAQAVFEVLADNVESFRLLEPPVRRIHNASRGLDSVRVAVT